MLGIVDRVAFTKFITKYSKSKHYDEESHGWKEKSKIFTDWRLILNSYYGIYEDKQAALEAAWASIISDYKMGIVLQKWNGSTFKALNGINVQYKQNTGSSINFGGGNNSPYESITIKGCNN